MTDVESLEGAVLVCLRHSFHGIYVCSNILETSFGIDDGGDISCVVRHNLAEEHVLQFENRLGVIQSTTLLKRLIEIRVCRLVVMLLGMKQSRLSIDLNHQVTRADSAPVKGMDLSLKGWSDVDRVGNRLSGSQGSTGPRKIA